MHWIAEEACNPKGKPIQELVEAFYGPTGPLADAGFEIRHQQVTMSTQIAKLPRNKRSWSIHEAPCGSGKGLAYLVPGILRALRAEAEWRLQSDEQRRKAPFRKLVVSTAAIPLQAQIVNKDLPALSKMLGVEIRGRVLKGRNNYGCWASITEAEESLTMWRGTKDPAAAVGAWIRGGGSGDKDEYPGVPEGWSSVSRTADDCTAKACKHYDPKGGDGIEPCVWRKAVNGYLNDHVLVMNHAFLTRAPAVGAVLLAIDEAHELEKNIRSSAERTLRMSQVESCVTALEKAALEVNDDDRFSAQSGGVSEVVGFAREICAELTLLARNVMVPALKCAVQHDDYGNELPPKIRPLQAGWLGDAMPETAATLKTLQKLIGDFGVFLMQERIGERDGGWAPPALKGCETAEAPNPKARRLCQAYTRASKICDALLGFSYGAPPQHWESAQHPWAFWVEGPADRREMKAQPGDITESFAHLLSKYSNIALTSATLPDSAAIRATFGAGIGDTPAPSFEERLPSPYPLETMGALIIPDLPDTKDQEWRPRAGDAVVEGVKESEGRALILCSSISVMNYFAKRLRDAHLPYPIRVQGEAGREELRRWFKENVDAVLVASRSFYAGLDVAGESLSFVVMDKMPFASPDDPIEGVVSAILSRRTGRSPFLARAVPETANHVAQGVGRLIRDPRDRGAVMLLDNRFKGSGEAWDMMRAALPPFPFSSRIEDIGNAINGRPLLEARKLGPSRSAATTSSTTRAAQANTSWL